MPTEAELEVARTEAQRIFDASPTMVFCTFCDVAIIPCMGLWGGWKHANSGSECCHVKVEGVDHPKATPRLPSSAGASESDGLSVGPVP